MLSFASNRALSASALTTSAGNLRVARTGVKPGLAAAPGILLIRYYSEVCPQEKLVILGSGWAGFKLLRNIDKTKYDVTVVSPRNHFIFTPMLAGTAVGSLEPRCITEPVRSFSEHLHYHQARCDQIDLEKKQILCTSTLEDNKGKTFSLNYDKLIISVGAYSNTFNTPGVKENGFFLKEIDDARRIRARILECFEYAAQPGVSVEDKKAKLHFCVVGGGPTGVEFSAELNDFICEDLTRLYPSLIPHVRITVYDVAPTILGTFDKNLADYATRKFRRDGIEIKTGSHVLEVGKGWMNLKEEGQVPFGLLVWATGITQNPIVASMKTVAKDDRTKAIVTNHKLQVLDKETLQPMENVYALGDCATIKGYRLPATAQVANQKAKYLSKALNYEARNGQKYDKDFAFFNRGSMAYIGSWKAVLDMSPVFHRAKEGGHLAWFFWRSAYLSMSISMRNKMLIPVYWFLTWIIGRDVTRL